MRHLGFISLRNFPTPASVPPVPTAHVNPSTLPSSWYLLELLIVRFRKVFLDSEILCHVSTAADGLAKLINFGA